MKKRKITGFWFFALATVMALLMIVATNTVLKDFFIIVLGVRAFKALNIGVIGAAVILCIIAAILGGLLLKRRALARKHDPMRKQREAMEQILMNYTLDGANPEFVRKRLELLRQELRGSEDLVSRCLAQMDKMDRLQTQQQFLIRTNEATYLEDTIAVLDDVERRICQNFRTVINLCIITDSIEQVDMEKVHKSLQDNDKKLSDSQELLKASADWINQYNADKTSDRSQLENWIAVIRDSLKEE